jgi:hypothetical protein
MIRIRKTFALVALAAALGAAADVHAQSSVQQSGVQSSVRAGWSRWRGSRNEHLINQAVRHFGYRPSRLTNRQVDAIQDTWYDLFGGQGARHALTQRQATAIVYMALVHPYEGDGFYEDGRPGRNRPGGGWNDRPGGGYDDPPPYRDDACTQMESDAYRLGNMISAPEVNTGLFVVDPEKGRARALARQIQQSAIECRASTVADRAAEVLSALSAPLPRRSDVESRVTSLKQAIQQTGGRRR